MADPTALDRYLADNHDGTWFFKCQECDEHASHYAKNVADTLAHDAWHEQVDTPANLTEVQVSVLYWKCPACGMKIKLGKGQPESYLRFEKEIIERGRRDWSPSRDTLLMLVYRHRSEDGCWLRTGLEWIFTTRFNRDAAVASEKSVPTAVYRHFDEDGLLLYVGCTSDPDNRARTHQRNAVWSLWAVDQTVEWYDSRLDGEAAETAAIESEQPIFNVTHNDRGSRRRQVEYLVKRDRLDLLSPAMNLTHHATDWLSAVNPTRN